MDIQLRTHITRAKVTFPITSEYPLKDVNFSRKNTITTWKPNEMAAFMTGTLSLFIP